MSSELRVDKIVPTAGVPTGGGGGIIQVVSNMQALGQINSPNNTNEFDTGLNCTITPKFNTSKILIMTCQHCRTRSLSNFYHFLNRGTTHIFMLEPFVDTSSWTAYNASITFLDSPATTSAVTYKTTAQTPNNSSGANLRYQYNNISGDDSTVHGELTGYGSRSSMTLFEVSG